MVRRSRVGAAALLALAATLVASVALRPALAQPASFSLSWQAPDDCPGESYVRGAVEQLLGGGPLPPARVTARAVVDHVASDRWQVHLTTVRDGATGERVVESQSCQSLADATALIVALTIDPERVAARAPSPSPSTSALAPIASAAGPASSAPTPIPSATPSATAAATPPSASSSPVPVPDRAREAPPARPTVLRPTLVALFAGVGGDVGTLPRATLAIDAGIAVTLGAFRLEGYGTYLTAQATYAAILPSLGTNVHLLAGGLRGCFIPLRGWIEAGGCAGLELGDLHGKGFGTLTSPYYQFTPSDRGGLWIAPTLTGRVSWRVAQSFALVLDVGLVVPLERDTFVIDNVGGAALHEAGPVEGRAAIGPEVRF